MLDFQTGVHVHLLIYIVQFYLIIYLLRVDVKQQFI